VADSPANLECRLTRLVQLEGAANFVVFGEVTGVHMRAEYLKDGRFEVTTSRPLSRLGYREYTVISDLFELARPDDR